MWPSVMEPKYTYGPFMKPFKKYKFWALTTNQNYGAH
jgi:hypothetical protein